jgi:Fe-S-cluster containining protein
MSDDVQRLLEAAYESSHRAMVAHLAGANTVEALLDSYRDALRGVDGSLQGALDWTQATVACRAGCSFCCSLQIDVRAHEVFLIMRHLRRTRSAEQLADLQASVVAARDHRRAASASHLGGARRKCVLLESDLCSIYEVRPAACRRYYSRSVAACEQVWHGIDPKEEIEIPLIAEIGRHVANGIHNAFVRAGFDGFCYELTAALAEALADPNCEARWHAGQKAFSTAAESVVPPGFSQAEAVVRLRESLGA